MGKINRAIEKQRKKFDRVQHKWQDMAKKATWWILAGAIAVDIIGVLNVLNPGWLDIGAILSPLYIILSFGTKTMMITVIAILSFIEEALPWLDWIPFTTIAWFAARYSYKITKAYKKL